MNTSDTDTVEASNSASSASAELAARICWHYFKEGQTQDVIARRLNLTRKRVNRILGEAQESGVVQISINSALAPCFALERGVADRYGLSRVIVTPAPEDPAQVRSIVGAAAGQYISEHLPMSASLGISWGGTINAAVQSVQSRSRYGNTVVLLCGGLAKSTRINPYDNAAMMARKLDATCYYITAPMHADNEALKMALVQSEPVRTVLGMVAGLDMALLSAIDLSEQSKALEYEIIDRKLWESLRAAGAVGDICGYYLDAHGAVVDHPLVRRTVAPALDDIRQIKERVLAAGGQEKVAVIRAAIAAGLVHTLITDERTATALLE